MYQRFFRRHCLELQFWGYEIGNVVAAIAGAGGPVLLIAALTDAMAEGSGITGLVTVLVQRFPEAAATMGVIALVVLAYPVARVSKQLFGPRGGDCIHIAAVPLALGLLGYSIAVSANPFTVAACAFVLASCLLRGAGAFPVLLKAGGLFLCIGGAMLSAAALTLTWSSPAEVGLVVVTVIQGLSVAGAGLLTYRGGIVVLSDLKSQPPAQGLGHFLDAEAGALSRFLKRHLDGPVEDICSVAVEPALFWISATDRATRPFYTSMMARLPWRLLAGAFALMSGTEIGIAFAIANLLWAIGDIAIGALDQPESIAETSA